MFLFRAVAEAPWDRLQEESCRVRAAARGRKHPRLRTCCAMSKEHRSDGGWQSRGFEHVYPVLLLDRAKRWVHRGAAGAAHSASPWRDTIESARRKTILPL